MESSRGNKVANQFEIYGQDSNGEYFSIFQSYRTTIAKSTTHKGETKIFLDSNYWDYSRTTGKYRNQFLGEGIAETRKKIDSGEYTLINLN